MFAIPQKIISFIFRYGIYPLTAYKSRQQVPLAPKRAASPAEAASESVKSISPEPVDIEARRVVNMMCNIKPKEASQDLLVSSFSVLSTHELHFL